MTETIAALLFLCGLVLNSPMALVAGEVGADLAFRYDPVFATASLAENCDVYLAPSEIGGWGVYAGRSFEEGEVVEIAPRFLALKSELLHQSVLDDYHVSMLLSVLWPSFLDWPLIGRSSVWLHLAPRST